MSTTRNKTNNYQNQQLKTSTNLKNPIYTTNMKKVPIDKLIESREGVYNNSRYVNITTIILGHPVFLKVKSGDVYHGIITAFSPDFEVALQCCHKVDPKNEVIIFGRSLPNKLDVCTLAFPKEDIVEILATDVDKDYALKSDNFTDSAITSRKTNGHHHVKEVDCKELEPFPFEEALEEYTLDNELDLDLEKTGWSADDMLVINETKYGYKSTFKSDLTEYTLAVEREDTEEYRRREAEAEKIALEIESSSAYKNNVDKELSDNEEEETAFSAVERAAESENIRTNANNNSNNNNNSELGFSKNNKNYEYNNQNKNSYQNDKYNNRRNINDQRGAKPQQRGILSNGNNNNNQSSQNSTNFKRHISNSHSKSLDKDNTTNITTNTTINKNQLTYNKRGSGGYINNNANTNNNNNNDNKVQVDKRTSRTVYNNTTTIRQQDNSQISIVNTQIYESNNIETVVQDETKVAAQFSSIKIEETILSSNPKHDSIDEFIVNNETSPNVDHSKVLTFYSNNDMNNNNYNEDGVVKSNDDELNTSKNDLNTSSTSSTTTKSKLNPFAQEFNPIPRSHMTSPQQPQPPPFIPIISSINQQPIPNTQPIYINPNGLMQPQNPQQPIYVIQNPTVNYPPPTQTPTYIQPILQQPPPPITPQQQIKQIKQPQQPYAPVPPQQSQQQRNQPYNNQQNINNQPTNPPQPTFIAFPGQLAPVMNNQGQIIYAAPPQTTPNPQQPMNYQPGPNIQQPTQNTQIRMYTSHNPPYIPFTQNPETQNTQIYCQNGALMYNPMLSNSSHQIQQPQQQQQQNIVYAPPSSTPTGIVAPQQSHTPQPQPQPSQLQQQQKPNQNMQQPSQQQPQQITQQFQPTYYYIPSSPGANMQGAMPQGPYAVSIPYPNQPNQQQYMLPPYITALPPPQQQQQQQQPQQQQQMPNRMFFVQNPNAPPYAYQNQNY